MPAAMVVERGGGAIPQRVRHTGLGREARKAPLLSACDMVMSHPKENVQKANLTGVSL